MITAISAILFLVQVSLANQELFSNKQLTVVECGFEKSLTTLFVRVPFFFLAILYVLFDIELILLVPITVNGGTSTKGLILLRGLILIVLQTLMLE